MISKIFVFSFLNRVGIYTTGSKERLKTERPQDLVKETTRIRTAKCLACTPQKVPEPTVSYRNNEQNKNCNDT